MRPEDFSIWLGIDVGKTDHWDSAINQLGEQVFSRALPNDEAKLRQLYQHLGHDGQILVVVDQPATIGALAVAVALDIGVTVAYLPGLAMRPIADLYPGNAKTDQRDVPSSSPRPPAPCPTPYAPYARWMKTKPN